MLLLFFCHISFSYPLFLHFIFYNLYLHFFYTIQKLSTGYIFSAHFHLNNSHFLELSTEVIHRYVDFVDNFVTNYIMVIFYLVVYLLFYPKHIILLNLFSITKYIVSTFFLYTYICF